MLKYYVYSSNIGLISAEDFLPTNQVTVSALLLGTISQVLMSTKLTPISCYIRIGPMVDLFSAFSFMITVHGS